MACVGGSTETPSGGAVIEAIKETDDVIYGFLEETIPKALNTLIQPSRNLELKEISKKLAEIGEDIEKSYENEFRQLFRHFGLSNITMLTYDEFVDLAWSVFANEIKWSNVIALIVFVRYTIRRFENDGPMVNKIVFFVLRFLKEKIAGWIASQGGWRAASKEVVEKARAISPILICIASCAVVVQAVLYVYSFRRR